MCIKQDKNLSNFLFLFSTLIIFICNLYPISNLDIQAIDKIVLHKHSLTLKIKNTFLFPTLICKQFESIARKNCVLRPKRSDINIYISIYVYI